MSDDKEEVGCFTMFMIVVGLAFMILAASRISNRFEELEQAVQELKTKGNK
jgi:hypothetical protein